MDDNLAVDGHDLQRAIDQLPLRQKAVLALRFAGYKQKDIRILLGISRNTVWADEKRRLHGIEIFALVGD